MTRRKATEATVEELRAAIEATADHRNAGGVPHDVRRRAVKYVAVQRAEGISSRATAATLGVHETTLFRWAREEHSRDVAFREVVVAERVDERGRGLRAVHAASGLVIEGLDVETLAALLGRLA
jgi:hypothetical protein